MTGAVRLEPRDYKRLAAMLTTWTGIQLHAKEQLMLGRLQPRLRKLGLTSFEAYVAYLETGGRAGSEATQFINALTTNKTSFFREAHHFDFLVQRVFAEAVKRAASGGPKRLRLWSAGCSLGAEPYTMAMLAAEHLPAAQGWDVKILATDVDTDVLAAARKGVYNEDDVAPIPPALRQRSLVHGDSGYTVHRSVSALVTFAEANLISRPLPVRGRFDVVFCRNVMIYFDRAIQQTLVNELVDRVAAGGYLVVGHSESMVAQHLPRVRETAGVYQPTSTQIAPITKGRVAPRERRERGPVRARVPVPGLRHKRIVLGEWFATQESMLVSTLLGSCVTACLYDPVKRIAGMNHFMLPRVAHDDAGSARFGVQAMELLINELMRLGAQRSRLRCMAFGAAEVNRALTSSVASQNGSFVREFLEKEQIPLVCERLGGTQAREVYLRTDTGEAFVRNIEILNAKDLQSRELAAYAQATEKPAEFNPQDALF